MNTWALPAKIVVAVILCFGLQTGAAEAKPQSPSSASKMTIKIAPELSYRLFVRALPPFVASVFGAPLKCIQVKCRTASD